MIAHPETTVPVVAVVSLGVARKLIDLRRVPAATVVFRSAREWAAVEGTADLAGPVDPVPWLAENDLGPDLHGVCSGCRR